MSLGHRLFRRGGASALGVLAFASTSRAWCWWRVRRVGCASASAADSIAGHDGGRDAGGGTRPGNPLGWLLLGCGVLFFAVKAGCGRLLGAGLPGSITARAAAGPARHRAPAGLGGPAGPGGGLPVALPRRAPAVRALAAGRRGLFSATCCSGRVMFVPWAIAAAGRTVQVDTSGAPRTIETSRRLGLMLLGRRRRT